MPRLKAPVPPDLLRLEQRLEQWRSAHPPRSRLPEKIWADATRLAQRHGAHRTARTLRMDYAQLRKRSPASRSDRPASPAFVELLASPTPQTAEWVVEMTSGRGKMRVEMKGMPVDWASLMRAWREAGV